MNISWLGRKVGQACYKNPNDDDFAKRWWTSFISLIVRPTDLSGHNNWISMSRRRGTLSISVMLKAWIYLGLEAPQRMSVKSSQLTASLIAALMMCRANQTKTEPTPKLIMKSRPPTQTHTQTQIQTQTRLQQNWLNTP